MLWERVFTWRLRQEIDDWEATGLLEAAALRQLREHYGFKALDQSEEDAGRWTRWILYLAIITFLAAFFSFAGSRAVDLVPAVRVGLLALGAVAAILTGFVIHQRHRIASMVLLVLGGMLLPISFFFAVHYYQIWLLSEPFLWWSVLGLIMAIGFGPLALQWGEAALATSALLSALSVPFLYAFHVAADPLVYPAIAVVLALALQFWRGQMPASWQAVWRFPLWSLGYGLAVAACGLPVMMRHYGTMGAAGIYFLAAVYFVFEVRTSQSTPTIASFVIALLAGIGALLRVGEVGLVYYPLVWLAVIVILLGVSLLVLRGRARAMAASLDTLQVLVWISSIGFWLLPVDDFQAFRWRLATMSGIRRLRIWALRHGMAGGHRTLAPRLSRGLASDGCLAPLLAREREFDHDAGIVFPACRGVAHAQCRRVCRSPLARASRGRRRGHVGDSLSGAVVV